MFKTAWMRTSSAVGIISIVTVLITTDVMFLALTFASFLALLYFIIPFGRYKQRLMKEIKRSEIKNYEFTFSEKGTQYKTETFDTFIAWSHYKFFKINGSEIYLYLRKGTYAKDIISERIIGQDNFKEVKEIIERNVSRG